MVRDIKLTKPPTLTKEIGAVLRQIRKEKGVTQKQLASALKVKQPVVSRAETGEVLTISVLDDIGYCLGFDTPQEFFSELSRRLLLGIA